jgi:hypothetical protein
MLEAAAALVEQMVETLLDFTLLVMAGLTVVAVVALGIAQMFNNLVALVLSASSGQVQPDHSHQQIQEIYKWMNYISR